MNHTRIERAILDEVERFQFAFPDLIVGTLSDVAVGDAITRMTSSELSSVVTNWLGVIDNSTAFND